MKRTLLALAPFALVAACSGAPLGPSPAPPAPSPSAAKTASREPPKLRLPGDVSPSRYDVELSIDPAKTTFSGVISISVTAKKAASVVWLHAQDIHVSAATFMAEGDAAKSGSLEVIESAPPFLGVVLPKELPEGGKGTLRIEYEAKIDPDKPQGVYSASEGAGPDDRYVYTLFEPLEARRAFPCFDEPSYKVPWKLTLSVPSGHGAFSNSEALGETKEGALKKVVFAETPPLPSYLVAFMVGPFDVLPAGTVGREKKALRFIVPRGRGGETRYAAQVTPAIILALEDYFGMAYPYSKLDVAVVPRYDGTLEHPGLVALGQPLTLIKPEEESLSRKRRYTTIAAHELAHYWFGDYVTMSWWDDTWLNESFAQWMDAKITEAVEPSWHMLRNEQMGRAFAAMDTDRLASAKRMRQPVESPADILNAFDGNSTYNKGASVITMLEHAVGPKEWQSVVRTFMKKRAWQTAKSDDFLSTLKEVVSPVAAESFESFLNQPGVPVVTVTPSCAGDSGDKKAKPSLKIEQRRFVPLGSSVEGSLWTLPVCVRYGAGSESHRICTFTHDEKMEVALGDSDKCPEWVIPNENGAGYYISGYSTEAIDRFVKKPPPAQSLEEHATMLRDVAFLVGNGSVPLGKALRLLPGAIAKEDSTILASAFSIFENVRQAELSPQLRDKLRAFTRKTFGPRAKKLGFSPGKDDTPETVQMRSMLLFIAGLGGRDPELLKTAHSLALRYLEDKNAISPDVVNPVLAIAMRSNDQKLFDKILSAARSTTDRSEKAKLLRALAFVNDKALVERALGLVLSPDFEIRDALPILYSMMHGAETRDAAWGFVKTGFDKMLERSTDFGKQFLFTLPEAFCDAGRGKEAEAFFRPRAKSVDGAERYLDNALEAIGLCESIHKASLPSLEEFLQKV